MMRKIILILLVVIPAIKPVYADTWACPPEGDYFSENKFFVAHVIPATKETKPRLEVFEIKDSEKIPLWHCILGNEGTPMDVFISDDGKYVATVNECSRRVHGGLGDYVVAFYNKKGLVKNYSLEQILHYPDEIDKKEFRKLTRRSVSGRSWAYRPMFFDENNGKKHFCVWLLYGKRWLAWQATDGKEIKITEKMIQRWNEKARLWAREVGINTRYYHSAADFLGTLKNPEDRKVIESLLADTSFYTRSIKKWKGEFIRYNASSPKRALAESILAQWDGKPEDNYYYLGTVEATLKLHVPPKAGDRWLCIYLVPGEVIQDNWYADVPVHRVTDYFWKYSFHNHKWPTSNISFRIQGVTPGKYRAKAVWDKAQPYNFGDNYIKGPPQKGDYQSLDSTVITIEAGKTVKGITIDCTHEVTNAAD
jgi:hypothetical protein